jgi:hypothetical protein
LECLGRPLSNILSEVTKVVPFFSASQFPHDDDVNFQAPNSTDGVAFNSTAQRHWPGSNIVKI